MAILTATAYPALEKISPILPLLSLVMTKDNVIRSGNPQKKTLHLQGFSIFEA